MRSTLTEGQQAAVIEAIHAGIPPADRAAMSPSIPDVAEQRWAAVPQAAYWAAYDTGLAIIRTDHDPVAAPDRYTFRLRTLDDRPGALVVTRGAAEIASTVQIGRFSDDGRLAADLRRAFLNYLDDFAAKPALTPHRRMH